MGTSELGVGKATINMKSDMTVSRGICERDGGWAFGGRSPESFLWLIARLRTC